jgi:hypothetical protein
MIGKIADEQDDDLSWDESIADLMKLLKLDSSLTARNQLAQELGDKGHSMALPGCTTKSSPNWLRGAAKYLIASNTCERHNRP